MNNKPRNIIFDLLLDFSSSNKSFKIIIEKSLNNLPELNKADKKFIINISKGILRYKTVLDFNISKYSKIQIFTKIQEDSKKIPNDSKQFWKIPKEESVREMIIKDYPEFETEDIEEMEDNEDIDSSLSSLSSMSSFSISL